jgi:hypothetical protein
MDISESTVATNELSESHDSNISNAEIEDPLDIKVYWYQIAVSVILGILLYYVVEFGFPFRTTSSTPIFLILLSGYWLMVWIFLILIIGVPLIIFRLKTNSGIFTCLKRAVDSIGTQVTLFLVISTLVFIINI